MLNATYPQNAPVAKILYQVLFESEKDFKAAMSKIKPPLTTNGKQQDKEVIPEIDVYLGIITQVRATTGPKQSERSVNIVSAGFAL